MNILFYILFFIFTIYIVIKSISYGIYEIREKSNKKGGIAVILLSILCLFLSNFSVISC